MIARRHPEATRQLGAPPGWRAGVHAGHGILTLCDRKVAEGNAMVTLWEPTPGELEVMEAGGTVELTVYGAAHPMVELGVRPREPELAPPVAPFSRPADGSDGDDGA